VTTAFIFFIVLSL